MRTAPLLLLSLAATVLVLGCSQQPPSAARPRSAPAAATSSAATPGRTLIALADAGALRLVALDGHQVASTGLSGSTTPVGAGGDFAAFVDGTTLKALHADGSVTTIGQLPGYHSDRVALSADGRQWLWSASTFSGATTTSRLVLSTAGKPDVTVTQQTMDGRSLRPYRWTPAGAVYENGAMGIGGYILFDTATGPSWRIDPATGQPLALSSSSCHVADVAADGTTACFEVQNGSVILTIARPGGGTVRVPLPRPRFQGHGAVSFRPGPTATELVVAGSPVNGPSQESYETDLVDVATGALRPFGPAGLRPGDGAWTWTADGSLIEYRPAGTLGGDPGVYLVRAGGEARKVFDSGRPIGVIAA